MAGNQPGRSGVRVESIDEFMTRRRNEVANLGRAATDAAYEAVRKSIRAGRNLRLSTPSEVAAYGANLLGYRSARTAAGREPPLGGSNLSGSGQRAKAVGGAVAHIAGVLPGMARGAIHTAAGAIEGAEFVAKLTNPALDFVTSAPGHSAAAQVVDLGGSIGNYVRRGVEDPTMVRRDIDSALGDFRAKQDPTVTPVAKTLGSEMKRRFEIGMNNGELLFDAGSLLVGGEAIKGAAGLGRAAKAADAVEDAWLAKNPGQAARFELPYPKTGMSHHIVNREAKLPALLGGGPYPEWFIESEFNKIRLDGLSTRDLYRNHRGVGGENHFTGGALGKKYGGGTWRTDDLGWDNYGPLDRLNFGTSPSTKAAVGPILIEGVVNGGGADKAR